MIEPLASDRDGLIYCTLTYFEQQYGAGYRTAQTWINTHRARTITRDNTVYIHLGDALRLHKDAKLRARAPRGA